MINDPNAVKLARTVVFTIGPEDLFCEWNDADHTRHVHIVLEGLFRYRLIIQYAPERYSEVGRPTYITSNFLKWVILQLDSIEDMWVYDIWVEEIDNDD